MKAYLITTGAIFGLVAVLHVLRAIDERSMLSSHPIEFLVMAGLGVLSAGLAVWACGCCGGRAVRDTRL
jgi:hypothetical protein